MGWISGMGFVDLVFISCALVGCVFFIVRLFLQFLGLGGHDSSSDLSPGMAHDVPAGSDGHDGSSDSGFKALSLQGLTAFLMMFGLVGLAMMRSFRSELLALLAGTLAGAVAVWVMGKIFGGMRNLQSSGTADLGTAAGKEATVYIRIPAKGTGKVMAPVSGQLMEVEAVSEDGTEIPSGVKVRVKRVEGSLLYVVRS